PAVMRGIAYLDSGYVFFVFLPLLTQITKLDISMPTTWGYDYSHPRHYCTRRICTVRRIRDNRHIPMRLAFMPMIGADGHQSCELSLSSRVGLQRYGGKTRQCTQLSL